MRQSCDIAVIGDGLIGATLARLLDKNGWRIAHFCRRPEPPDTGLSLSLNLSSQRLLGDAGIWRHIPTDVIGWFDRVRVWDGDGNRLDFSHGDTPGCIIRQKDLLNALKATPDAAIHPERIIATIRRLATRHADMETTTGEKWRARLIIAADGADSRIRDQANIRRRMRHYRQNALVCPVLCEKKHGHIARQFFLASGPLALLPEANEKRCFIVWSTTPSEAARLQEAPPDTFAGRLEAASRHVLGNMRLAGERKLWPLRRLEAEDYFCGRVALVGDAAHVPHPLAGMGANMGLMDVHCLVSILTRARDRGMDIGSRRVLRAYERQRRPINHLALTVTDAIKYMFATRTPLLQTIRRFGIRCLAASPSCQRQLTQIAAGLYDDWPRGGTTTDRNASAMPL